MTLPPATTARLHKALASVYSVPERLGLMKAYLGTYTARLEMPWVRSLKEKRALVKPAMERLKARYPVSAARLAGQDNWGWEVVGFTILGWDSVWVEETLKEAARFLVTQSEFQVAEEQWSVDEVGLEALLPIWSK